MKVFQLRKTKLNIKSLKIKTDRLKLIFKFKNIFM